MSEFHVIRRGDFLAPATPSDLDELKKLDNGDVVRVKYTRPRNARFHRKGMALLQLAFEYWEPKTMISNVEQNTVDKLGKFLIHQGVSPDAINALCGDFLATLEKSRETVSVGKSFNAFRDWVKVEAGYYDTVQTPAGPKKIPRSVSFSAMSESEFKDAYKAFFDVCWNVVLSTKFNSEQEAENATYQLLDFD